MCGRVAQTVNVVNEGARIFAGSSQQEISAMLTTSPKCDSISDNFNLSPGMDCQVYLINEKGEFQVNRKKWGIITKSGTAKKPLYTNERELIKLCFDSLCFNARSDTLCSKPTFSKLVNKGRSCIIALDGYFEWKPHPIPKMNKTKQPYFVYRKQELDQDAGKHPRKPEPLLVAGIWTSVATGIPNASELGSFAILTTDACEQIKWLHHRMPVCIWNLDLAKQWLLNPTEALKKKLDDSARSETKGFSWHKVTPEMSKLSFRSKEAIIKMKETNQSIQNFFTSVGSSPRKNVKKEINHCLKQDVGSRETSQKIKKKSSSDPPQVSVAAAPRDFFPAISRPGKRQSNFQPDCPQSKRRNLEKNALKKSPTCHSKKQITINSFFHKR